jgi:serine/threonine protein kinase
MELPDRTSDVLKLPIAFKTVKEAGTGGYSIVYEVVDPATSRKYALKKVASVDPDGHDQAGEV